jgi:uncharacterized membrane protein YkvA (DUF1232 family)/plasmid maintenance system antidote protein VapI
MSNVMDNNLGLLLKKLLKERSLSMRKVSQLTGIDVATISRIINGKRKANPDHLQKFADCLEVPIVELFTAVGFPIEQNENDQDSDIHTFVERIQNELESANLYDNEVSIASVEQQLTNYQQFAQTEEGTEYILRGFEEKVRKVGSIGPFISQLKDMFEKFRLKKGTELELALIGSALVYFIVPVDVIPDYIFPFGFIDDAIAVQIVTSLVS